MSTDPTIPTNTIGVPELENMVNEYAADDPLRTIIEELPSFYALQLKDKQLREKKRREEIAALLKKIQVKVEERKADDFVDARFWVKEENASWIRDIYVKKGY